MSNTDFSKFAKEIDKIPFATSITSDESLVKVSEFLSFGHYATNAICTGSLHNGIPFGRFTTLFGESQSGKSLLSALLQKSATDNDMRVVIFDSEGDKDGRLEKSFGVNLENVQVIPIDTVEQLTLQANKVLKMVLENEKLYGKVFFIVDSLGGVASSKILDDADKNKTSQDMGLTAKAIKNFFKITRPILTKIKCPFLIINHEIADPGQLHQSVFKKQGGGQAIEFYSTLMINVGKRKEKQDATNELDESSVGSVGYTGQAIKIFTHKNRVAIPHKRVEIYLNFKTGIDKFSGLKDIAEELGVIYTISSQGEKGKGFTYYVTDLNDEEHKLGRFTEWRNDQEKWNLIFPSLDSKIEGEFKYSEHV